jgi:hypothetical protein
MRESDRREFVSPLDAAIADPGDLPLVDRLPGMHAGDPGKEALRLGGMFQTNGGEDRRTGDDGLVVRRSRDLVADILGRFGWEIVIIHCLGSERSSFLSRIKMLQDKLRLFCSSLTYKPVHPNPPLRLNPSGDATRLRAFGPGAPHPTVIPKIPSGCTVIRSATGMFRRLADDSRPPAGMTLIRTPNGVQAPSMKRAPPSFLPSWGPIWCSLGRPLIGPGAPPAQGIRRNKKNQAKDSSNELEGKRKK